jgi:hypothetical protein
VTSKKKRYQSAKKKIEEKFIEVYTHENEK